MEKFTKVVRIGTAKTFRGRSYSIFCKITYSEREAGQLCISGVEGPTRGGNALGACGQIDMHLKNEVAKIAPALGWSHGLIREFLAVWDRWHLNTMKAGTSAQEAHLKAIENEFPGYPMSHYDWACKRLDIANLLVDNGYKYGTSWLREEVPEDVLKFLKSLPDTDKQPAWI